MDEIPMVDLEAQHRPLARELQGAIGRVLASNRFIQGAEVAAFERMVAAELGVQHAVGMSSGSDALVAMLAGVGVGPGDEVVTTPYTFFATVEAILRVGARPVFADIDPTTLNLDEAAAAERIGPATRAVLPVHLFGRVAGRGLLREICAQRGVALLEDAAQAIGAPDVGKIGEGAALSFFPSKNLGGFGDGGMVVTDDGALATRCRLIRNHGAEERSRHVLVGGNFRLDELQAALLAVKLPHLRLWTEERRRVARIYRRLLAELPVELPPADDGCVWNQYVIRTRAETRTALVEHLTGRGIASAIYYPRPLHLQPALAALGHREGDFPEAERAAREALALPIYPELSEAQIGRIAEALAVFFR